MAKAMERYKVLVEEGAIFLLMSVFTVLKQLVSEEGSINWGKSFAKVFINLISGWSLYSFLLAYKPWYGEYPQKIGVIMFVVYGGTKLIDLTIDAVYKLNFKEIVKRWMGL